VIAPDEIQFMLSNPVGSSGNTGPGFPGNSLGNYMSFTPIDSPQPLDDLFLDISGVANAAGQVDYQCLFVMNNTASGFTMKTPYLWMPAQSYTLGGATLAFGLDPTGVVAYNSGSPQAVTTANSLTAPAGVSFIGAPQAVYTAGLLTPDIPPLKCIAVWIQRTATNSPQQLPQTLSLQVTFVSNA